MYNKGLLASASKIGFKRLKGRLLQFQTENVINAYCVKYKETVFKITTIVVNTKITVKNNYIYLIQGILLLK